MIKVKKENLAPAMKKLAKIAGKKSSIPIMNHIAVDFDGDTLTLTANDGSATYSARMDAHGEPCQFTTEAAKLAASVSAMRAGEIELTDGQVKQGRSRIKLDCGKYSEFPQPDYGAAEPMKFSADALGASLAAVSHAVATDDVRYYLNGACLVDGNAVATNGHRMAWADLGFDGKVIIPHDAVNQIIGMTGTVSLSQNQMIIENDSERFSTKLVEGNYPDWKRVIPTGTPMTIKASAGDILEALQAAQIGGETAKFEVSPESVTISNAGAEAAFSCESEGDMTIGFSIKYLIDAIKACGDDTIVIQLFEPNRPCIVGGNNVVMPVRL